MFDFVRNNTRVLFFILLLLVIPSFVLIGTVDRMPGRGGQQHEVAHVGRQGITQAEWDRAHQQNVDRIRRQMPEMDIKAFDTPAAKMAALEELLRQKVLAEAAKDFHVQITDENLRRTFTTDPQFSFVRNPDGSVNKALLSAQGMSSEAFTEMLRQGIAEQRVVAGVANSGFLPASLSKVATEAFFQQREVQVQYLEPRAFASKVLASDEQLQAFYKEPAMAARFLVPEQLDVEYAVLDLDHLSRDIQVSDDELKTTYAKILKDTPQRFGKPEERRASHILIGLGSSEQSRANARAKADALLEALKKNPRSFAELARKNSEDAGSAKSGGDLDYLTRDGLVPAFADALFSLKEGEVSDVVETDQGFHIITMTAQRGGEIRSFESVHDELLAELRKSEAQKRYVDASLEFTNMVFEQSDTLKPAADKWKLELLTAKGLTRNGKPGDAITSSPKFLEAVFASDAIRDKRNTPAIEIGPSQLVAARVVQHEPARQPALDEVRELLRGAFVERESAVLARKAGEETLKTLKAQPPATLSQPSELVSRAESGNFPRQVLEKVLLAPAAKLPAVVGLDLANKGYAIALITRVVGVDPSIAKDPEKVRSSFAQAWTEAEDKAYFEALKKRFKAEIKVKQ